MLFRWAIRCGFLLIVGLLLAVAFVETDEVVEAQIEATCPVAIQRVLETVSDNCGTLGRNAACYGFNNVQATFIEDVPVGFFSRPSDRAAVGEFRTITTSPLNLEANEWGIAIMNVQANVPNTLPGQGVVFMLSGDTFIEDLVDESATFSPEDAITLVVGADEAPLRSQPSVNANAVLGIPAAEEITADALDVTGSWVRVSFNDQIGWVDRGQVAQDSAIDALPVVPVNQQSPMQTFRFTTGIGTPNCEEAPDALVIQGPENFTVNFTANGADISLGSTTALQTVGFDSESGEAVTDTLEMIIYNLDGTVVADGDSVPVGTFSTAPLDSNLEVAGDWTDPEPIPDDTYEQFGYIENVDDTVFNYSLDIPGTDGVNVPVVEEVPVEPVVPQVPVAAALPAVNDEPMDEGDDTVMTVGNIFSGEEISVAPVSDDSDDDGGDDDDDDGGDDSGDDTMASGNIDDEDPPETGGEPTLGTGEVQITLTWDTVDDLDLHVIDPEEERIYFGNPVSASGGVLDFDANAGSETTAPVENIFFEAAILGTYTVEVYVFSGFNTTEWGLTIKLFGEVAEEFSGTTDATGDDFYEEYGDYGDYGEFFGDLIFSTTFTVSDGEVGNDTVGNDTSGDSGNFDFGNDTVGNDTSGDSGNFDHFGNDTVGNDTSGDSGNFDHFGNDSFFGEEYFDEEFAAAEASNDVTEGIIAFDEGSFLAEIGSQRMTGTDTTAEEGETVDYDDLVDLLYDTPEDAEEDTVNAAEVTDIFSADESQSAAIRGQGSVSLFEPLEIGGDDDSSDGDSSTPAASASESDVRPPSVNDSFEVIAGSRTSGRGSGDLTSVGRPAAATGETPDTGDENTNLPANPRERGYVDTAATVGSDRGSSPDTPSVSGDVGGGGSSGSSGGDGDSGASQSARNRGQDDSGSDDDDSSSESESSRNRDR